MSRRKILTLSKFISGKSKMNINDLRMLHGLNISVKVFNNLVLLGIVIKMDQLPSVVKPLSEILTDINPKHAGTKKIDEPSSEPSVSYDDPAPVFWIDDKKYLTEREVEIMERLALGRYNKWIAEDLHLKECTIANNFQRIFRKFGISNRTEALVAYQKCKSWNKLVS